MLLSKVKSIFENKVKISGGLKMPDDTVLADVCYESLRYVATKCIPAELLRDTAIDTDSTVFRLVHGGAYIADPEFPDFASTKHMMIDEELSYAVINKMAALSSRDANDIAKFESETARLINMYKANYMKVLHV